MKKYLLIAAAFAGSFTLAQAQAPLVGIPAFQEVSVTRLQNCDDAPALLNTKVKIRGVVINRGNANATTGQTREVWIRDLNASATNLYSAVSSRAGAATIPVDERTLLAGDTVEIVGTVSEFLPDAQTQITPDSVTLIGSGPAPEPYLINIGQLNDANRVNVLETGERYESDFVEIRNVTVNFVDPFTSAGVQRVSFNVVDAAGNVINISDRFLAQRMPQGTGQNTCGTNNPLVCGNFVPIAVGQTYTSIKGIVIHNKNGCNGLTNNRGYSINPFEDNHYQKGVSAPTITKLFRTIAKPTSTDVVRIDVTIFPGTDAAGNSATITTASLLYKVGAAGTYTSLPLTIVGNTGSANIPAQPDGSLVSYYATATNNQNLSMTFPNVPNNANPQWYIVKNGALTIRDVQYTPYSTATNGYTGFEGIQVTLSGRVTSQFDTSLGAIFIQDFSLAPQEYAGIWVNGDRATLGNAKVGMNVTITGVIEEKNQTTRINATAMASLGTTGPVTPMVLDPLELKTWGDANSNKEKYESMLVTIQNPAGQLSVIDTNYLVTQAPGRNFGEWRVGTNPAQPGEGTVVLTGVTTGDLSGSSWVNYINNTRFKGINPIPYAVINPTYKFASITGIVYQSFNYYKVMPRNNNDFAGVTGVKQALLQGVKMYPNPAKGQVNISFEQAVNKAYTVRLSTINGQVVSSRTANGTSEAINLNGVSNGMYVVTIVDNNGALLFRDKLVVNQ